VQLDAAVMGSGETTAAQAAGVHPIVAAILLRHHICRDLGRTEWSVGDAIDGTRLVDAIGKARLVVVPPHRQFFQTNGVGKIPVDLVRAHLHEGRRPHMAT